MPHENPESSVSTRDIRIFNDSYARCNSRPDFLNRFYEIFFTSSEKAAKKFEHTDVEKQAAILKSSLHMMALSASGNPEGKEHMEGLAERHSRRDLDIEPEFYDVWLDCLVKTVEEFDPRFDENIGKAWRKVMKPGIDFMKSRY